MSTQEPNRGAPEALMMMVSVIELACTLAGKETVKMVMKEFLSGRLPKMLKEKRQRELQGMPRQDNAPTATSAEPKQPMP